MGIRLGGGFCWRKYKEVNDKSERHNFVAKVISVYYVQWKRLIAFESQVGIRVRGKQGGKVSELKEKKKKKEKVINWIKACDTLLMKRMYTVDWCYYIKLIIINF